MSLRIALVDDQALVRAGLRALLERGIIPVEVEIAHRRRTTGTSSMKLVRGAVHRFLFVLYIALRQLLLRLNILVRPKA